MLIRIAQSAYDEIKKEILKSQTLPKKKLTEADSLSEDFEARTKLENKFGLKETDYVGQGLFNIVYIKNNLVYKFTRNREDVLKAVLLKQLGTNIPEKYIKHIMHIEDFGYDEEAKAYYLITEKLDRISQTEKSLLLGNVPSSEQNLAATTLLTPSNLDIIIDIIKQNSNETQENLEIIDSLKYSYKQELLSLLVSKIELLDFSSLNKPKNKEEELALIKENAKLFSGTIINSIYRFLKFKLNINIKINLLKAIQQTVALYLSNDRFPVMSKQDNKYNYKKDRFGFELLEFLKYLKTQGIEFNDTHTGNIMKRKNGDLVLSDVGLFRIL